MGKMSGAVESGERDGQRSCKIVKSYPKKSLDLPCHVGPFAALLRAHISQHLPHTSPLRNPKCLQRIAVAPRLLLVAYLVEIRPCHTE